jgi:hypothetical protein
MAAGMETAMDTIDFSTWLYGAAAIGATVGFLTAALMQISRDSDY